VFQSLMWKAWDTHIFCPNERTIWFARFQLRVNRKYCSKSKRWITQCYGHTQFILAAQLHWVLLIAFSPFLRYKLSAFQLKLISTEIKNQFGIWCFKFRCCIIVEYWLVLNKKTNLAFDVWSLDVLLYQRFWHLAL
jgi:hypothetical protein